MTPLYEHRQIAWPTVIGAGVAGLLLVAGLFAARVGLTLPAALVAIPILVLLFFGSMTVRVFSDNVRVYFGVGAPWFTIDLREARGYRVVRNPWFYGWGIRLIPGGVMYNASGLDAVELRLDGGRIVRIGTDAPHELASAIGQAVAPDNFPRDPDKSALPWSAIAVPVLFFAAGITVAASMTCGRVHAGGQTTEAQAPTPGRTNQSVHRSS